MQFVYENGLLDYFSFSDSNTLFHNYLIFIAQTFMVVLYRNILIKIYLNYCILSGENLFEEFGKFLMLHLMS